MLRMKKRKGMRRLGSSELRFGLHRLPSGTFGVLRACSPLKCLENKNSSRQEEKRGEYKEKKEEKNFSTVAKSRPCMMQSIVRARKK